MQQNLEITEKTSIFFNNYVELLMNFYKRKCAQRETNEKSPNFLK